MRENLARSYTGGLTVKDVKQPSGIAKATLDYLDRVTYKRMTKETDLEAVFRLRHDNYKRVGHFEGNESGQYSDPLDFIDTARHIGVFLDEKLAGCVRLHTLNRQHRKACAMETYADVLNPKLDNGLVLVDTSRFCCDPETEKLNMALPLSVIRVTGVLAIHEKADFTLSTVSSQHAPFYKRILGATDWAEEGARYPGLNVTVHLLAADVRNIARMNFDNRQYFWSTKAEREALFGDNPSDSFVSPSARDVVYEGVDPEYDA